MAKDIQLNTFNKIKNYFQAHPEQEHKPTHLHLQLRVNYDSLKEALRILQEEQYITKNGNKYQKTKPTTGTQPKTGA